jgi:threonine dehydratase
MTEQLSLARIEEASRVIDPLFRDSPQFVDPQLSAALGREVTVKVETANALGSFKGRGADFFVRDLEPGGRLVCSTGGNFGQALAYVGRRRGFSVDVFVSAALDQGKLARIRALATETFVIDGDEERAKEAAREHAAAQPGSLFVEDGREVAISEGAGTIGVELVAAEPIDTLVVQVGDGALIGGVARWVKERSPSTRVVGVCASGSPAMFRSWREGRAIDAPADTIASALAVARPVPESVARIRPLIDEFVLVDDADMIDAMRHDLDGERVAVLLTGHGVPRALWDAVFESGRGGLP